jgi:hypothetical protein
LHDGFIKDELDLDPKVFHQDFSSAFQELNKRTHLRPDTVITDPVEIEDFANDAIGALSEIFDVIDDVRDELVRRIEPTRWKLFMSTG